MEPSLPIQLPTPRQSWKWAAALRAHGWLISIIFVALLLRLLWLEDKPPHFDEGVNGYFVDQITRNGFYHYDPSNFHGPLHFYALFIAQTLLGRAAWAMRLPVALISAACVWMVLLFRPYFGQRATQCAALAMAISTGMVFYGRDAIHETWLLFFLLLTFWGMAGLWYRRTRRDLWATALGVAGMILTKETYVIHVICFLLAALTLAGLELLSPSASDRTAQSPEESDGTSLPRQDGTSLPRVLLPCATALGIIVFFYSGCFMDWSSLPGLWQTFSHWVSTGTEGASGHEKPWSYWLKLIGRYELPAVVGLAVAPIVLWPGQSRMIRFTAIYGVGALTAYSLIAYKTPWCLICLIWPFHFLFGVAIAKAFERLDRTIVAGISMVVLGMSLGTTCLLNFRDQTDETEPYVYVQTLPDYDKLTGPLSLLTDTSSANFHIKGYIIGHELHPWIWALGDFTSVTMHTPDEALPDMGDGAFLLIDDQLTIESQLTEPYFKELIKVRGNGPYEMFLYLRAETFGICFPGRIPEFTPGQSEGTSPTLAPDPTVQ